MRTHTAATPSESPALVLALAQTSGARAGEALVSVVQGLSFARSLAQVQAIAAAAARRVLGADGATFVLRDGDFACYVEEDAIAPLWKGRRFPLESCISGWVMRHRAAALVDDIYEDRRIPHDLYRPTFVKSLVMVPIRQLDPIGAIGCYWAERRSAGDEEVRLLQALADSVALAIENVRLYEELESSRRETLERLAVAAEYRDDGTHQHTQRVAITAHALARALGMSDVEADVLRLAAPLHDIGKLSIPDEILLKPGKLTDVEFALVKQHTVVGAMILADSASEILERAREIALSHHEWWDGSGYPHGLREEAIPLSGRIVGIADVFDALTHDRPYKLAWPLERAVAEIAALRASQFDPDIVDAFMALDHEALVELPPARLPSIGDQHGAELGATATEAEKR